MKKNILIPVVLLATTPFVVACTKKPTDMPPPPPVTGETETITPTPLPTESTPAPATSDISLGADTTSTATPTAITRTEIISYDSKTPEGIVEVEFSVTVTDGVITAATAVPKTDKQGSNYNQNNFAKELSTKVVGKKASDLNIDAIGGASLTTTAFETFVHSF